MMISRRSLLAGLLATAVTPMRLPGRPIRDGIGQTYLMFENIPLERFERFKPTPIGISLGFARPGQLVEVALVGTPHSEGRLTYDHLLAEKARWDA